MGEKKRPKSYTLLVFLLLATILSSGTAHIHSQKVRGRHEEATVSGQVWLMALCSAVAVSSCGVLPLLFGRCMDLRSVDGGSGALRLVLSFAVGSLLGDVWLHLLPEAWGQSEGVDSMKAELQRGGFWLILGLITFMSVEKLAKHIEEAPSHNTNNTNNSTRHISGYLNLLANITDNFTHGLAIAASYLVSPLVGLLTTLAILCHEIPHEIGDFAILLRSGFTCPDAAVAQLVTASGGLVGVIVGLSAQYIGQCTSWMLPFTAGGFLYIALVSIIPELMEDSIAPVKQVGSILLGILIMAAVTIIEKKSCNAMPYAAPPISL